MPRLKLVGAYPNPEVAGEDELPGKSNYFIGDDPSHWHTNVSTYAKVRYKDVHPGIDLVYYGNQRELEYDFVVAPGADPTAIQFAVEGADNLVIDAHGDLAIDTAAGQVRLRKPLVYQEAGRVRGKIAAGYVLQAENRIGFRVDSYDVSRPLVIHPAFVYATYLVGGGGSFADGGIAVDNAGNAYVT